MTSDIMPASLQFKGEIMDFDLEDLVNVEQTYGHNTDPEPITHAAHGAPN